MARQIIKTTASRFEVIQEGHQTCVILKNDRLWSTYDELWFVECGKDRQPTGRVVRARITFIQHGLPELEDAHSLMSIRPLGRGLEVILIESTTKDIIAAVMDESYKTLLIPGKPRQEMRLSDRTVPPIEIARRLEERRDNGASRTMRRPRRLGRAQRSLSGQYLGAIKYG